MQNLKGVVVERSPPPKHTFHDVLSLNPIKNSKIQQIFFSLVEEEEELKGLNSTFYHAQLGLQVKGRTDRGKCLVVAIP